jgi:hypothetical protein
MPLKVAPSFEHVGVFTGDASNVEYTSMTADPREHDRKSHALVGVVTQALAPIFEIFPAAHGVHSAALVAPVVAR